MKSFGTKHVVLGALILLAGGLSGCTTTTHTEVTKPAAEEYLVRNVPGVVDYTHEPQMIDSIDVPPGLDPEGVTYRLGHTEIVEIRPGRWQLERQPSK